MKLDALIGGTTRTFDIDERNGSFRLVIDDRVIEGNVLEPEPGTYTFRIGDRVLEFRVGVLPGGDIRRVTTPSGITDVKIIDRKRRGPGAEADDAGQRTLTAPMPGKVVAILAGVGTAVERGHGVLVVEAMKMQNEVKAAIDGVVAEIRVAVGDTVNGGQVLARLE